MTFPTVETDKSLVRFTGVSELAPTTFRPQAKNTERYE